MNSMHDAEAGHGAGDGYNNINKLGNSRGIGTAPRVKSWAELRDDVRSVRRRLWTLGYRLPHSFVYRSVFKTHEPKTRIYFMSSPQNSKDNSVYAIDVPKYAPTMVPAKPPQVIYPWIQVLPSGFQGSGPPSKEEQLLMERKRMTPTGIAAYDFHEQSAKFVFTASSALFECVDNNIIEPLLPTEINTPRSSGARLNAEICPIDPDLIAYVNNGDLFVVNSASGFELQLTHTPPAVGTEKKTISAGYPSYIMQEEFNRFNGFWWQPTSDDGLYRILYEEVNESEVGMVNLLSLPGQDKEQYRFPTPGTPNAKSTLRLIQFDVVEGEIRDVVDYAPDYSIKDYFKWTEYIVRAGWTPDGRYIWAELLNREQQKLELILIPSLAAKRKNELNLVYGSREYPSAPVYVVYSESTDVWINVHDMLVFLPCETPDAVQFLWASEETGFRHIYSITSALRPCIDSCDRNNEEIPVIPLTPMILEKIQLTGGDWEVLNTPLSLMYAYGLMFFTGLKDSPIERHLYVTSFRERTEPRRLTELGYSYSAIINPQASLVILTYSSTTSPPLCQLFRIKYNNEENKTYCAVSDVVLEPLTYFHSPPRWTARPKLKSKVQYTHNDLSAFLASCNPRTVHSFERMLEVEMSLGTPEICSHRLDSGEEIYTMIYKPVNFNPKKKYPTILNVYGGPEVQLVYNSFKGTGQLWLYLLASQGYCVVAIDSRGSHHRGVRFEGHIRKKMGTVELKDQVEILTVLAENNSYIDMKRVGIYGWSYGGYLSLMGLAHYPSVFKVCVAGAPVTSWDLYDTGYTERYMGLPHTDAASYQQSSVLTYIQQFPDEQDRLLIVHGLVDENVHFTHTAQLVNALIRAGKPHLLQLYPNERHSLRRLEASEHYETMLLSFLQRCL